NLPEGQPLHLHLHFSHLADALIQSDLQEQLGLSALLKGTFTSFSRRSYPERLTNWCIHPIASGITTLQFFFWGGRRITLSYPRYSLKRWGFKCLRKVVSDSAVLAS
ncbi:hypothetical protein J4Q44_G00127900, partial [Coregonus suidteri]